MNDCRSNNTNKDRINESSGFNLLDNSSIINPKGIIMDLDLVKIKEYDKSNYLTTKINSNNNNNDELYKIFQVKKKLFLKDSFYNNILSTKEKIKQFENLYKNTNFKMFQNEDKSNSSVFFYYKILPEIENNKDIKEIEININTQINSLIEYKKENIAIITNQYKCEENINNIKFYRKVKVNGNSFYISFMYQYFTYLIKSNNESEISYIFTIDKELNIVEDNKKESLKDNDLNLGKTYINESFNNDLKNYNIQAFIYINIIYKKTIDKKIDEALKILDYCFSYEENFVYILCKYMRFRIKRFINNNKDIFTYEKYCNQYNLINEKYFNDNDKIFLYENYIKENVNVEQMEPSLFIVSIVPYVFNINLNLYINEQSIIKESNEPLYINFTLHPNNAMINILYTSYSYHIIEFEENKNSYLNNPDFSNIFNITNNGDLYNNLKANYIININNNENCQKCNCFEFIKFQNINTRNEICLNCFKKTIYEVFEQRYYDMLNNEFKYIEYYLKDIPLLNVENNNYIYLTSAEFYFLFNSNIFTFFRELIEYSCDICGKIQKNNKIINKICGCKRCFKCAKNETNNNIFLNEFEKNYIYKNELIKCECGKEISKVDYCDQIVKILEKEEKEGLEIDSEKRIIKYIENYCMICGNFLKKSNEDCNYNFENNIRENKPHLVCRECIGKINTINKQIKCIICNKEHEQQINKEIKKNKKITIDFENNIDIPTDHDESGSSKNNFGLNKIFEEKKEYVKKKRKKCCCINF